MCIFPDAPVRGDTVYVSISRDAEIALRDLDMQVGRTLTFHASDGHPEHMLSQSHIVVGEDLEPEYTIPVYGISSSPT